MVSSASFYWLFTTSEKLRELATKLPVVQSVTKFGVSEFRLSSAKSLLYNLDRF